MAGKRGKCPHCQAAVIIGGAAIGSAEASTTNDLTPLGGNDLTPLPVPPGDDLFAGLPPLLPLPALDAKVLPDGPPLNPLGVSPASWSAAPLPSAPNPYASSARANVSGRTAPTKLAIPAVLIFLVSLVSIGLNLYQGLNAVNHPERALRFTQPRSVKQVEATKRGYVIGAVIGAVISVIINGVVMAGAIQMIRLKGWDMAKAGAIVALIPCCSVLCANIPLGIWALLVLHQPDIRRQFQ
jgi:hypothetical protein